MTEDPPQAPPAPPPRYSDESLKDGMNRMRETAKWLILAFGAVLNSFILAGIGLADLAKVDDDNLPVAIAAVAVAILAVVVGLLAASRVLASGQVSLSDLKNPPDDGTRKLLDELGRNEDLYPGYESIQELVEDITGEAEKQVSLARKLFGGAKEGEAEYRTANQKVKTLRPLSDRLQLVAAFTDVRRKLDLHRWVVAGSFVVVAAAAVVFALSVGEEEKPAATTQVPRLSLVSVDLTARGEKLYGQKLGRNCNTNQFRAAVLGGENGRVDVVALPAARCHAAELDIGKAEAVLEPVELPPVEIP